MLKFLTRIFAVIGFLFVLMIGLTAVVMDHFAERPTPEPKNIILTLNFDNATLKEDGGTSSLSLAFHEEQSSLLDILRAIDKAKADPNVKGIVARFGSSQPKMVEAYEMRSALKSFRESGKFTYAFGASYGGFGGGNRAYYLASAFENIWLQPVGGVGLTGLALEEPFGKTALDKIGVKADFMQREEYKSFMDMATRDDFAPPVRQNMQSLLDDLARQIAEGIAESRGFKPETVRDLMTKGPFTDEEALKEKLVTRLGYYDELDAELDAKAGKDSKNVDVADYLAFKNDKTTAAKANIALIYGSGLIMDHDDGAPSIASDKVMGADTIADAFDSAATDDSINAILFRVDSPGGSPEASETIRRAVVQAKKSGKPVFVSMGDTAASGGYWVSMNADHIVAAPATLTGSIGVLAGKFALGGLLQKLGVSVGSIKTSENAGMLSMTDGFTPKQRDRMNALLDNTYRSFTQNVSKARNIPAEKIPDVAKGRVWTGAQAAKIGLVDEVGGFATTLKALRKQLKLADTDQVSLEVFPAPESPIEKFMKLMKSLGVEEAAIRPIFSQLHSIQTIIGIHSNQTLLARSPIDAGNIK